MAHLEHQRAAPGAELGHDGIGGLAGEFIHMCQIQPAHFTEQAGNFRCRHEVPGLAEGVARLVIAGVRRAEAFRHVVLERHGAVRLYAPADMVLECLRRGVAHRCFCRQTR